MPAAFPPEFRQRAVELARERAKPLTQIRCRFGDFGVVSGRWVAQADVVEGKREGLSTSEREELARLRKENRVLSRAAAFFASENVLPR